MTITYFNQMHAQNTQATTEECKELLDSFKPAPGPWKRIHKSGNHPLVKRIFENNARYHVLMVETLTHLIMFAGAETKEELVSIPFPPGQTQPAYPQSLPSASAVMSALQTMAMVNGHPLPNDVAQSLHDMLGDTVNTLEEKLNEYLAGANHGLQHHYDYDGPSGIEFSNGMLHVGILSPALSIPISCLPTPPAPGQTGEEYIEEHFNWY